MRQATIVLLFLAIFLISTPLLQAQTVGACEPAQAEAYLDVGNVRARILNNGSLFWRGSPSVYEVPKGSGTSPIFVANLWLAGLVEGDARAAASYYGPNEFWAGPLEATGSLTNDCALYDEIHEVTRTDIERYRRTGERSQNLVTWPAHLGAPVVDGDGDPTNYNLAGGDIPALRGDQTLWWVMNDAGNEHRRTKSLPLGMEVHGTAFAFDTPGFIGTSTFYQFDLHYKGTAPLDSFYVGIHVDPDLGNFDDDYVGSDTTLDMGYVYNADDFDEGSEGYGAAPPATGFVVLQGPRPTPTEPERLGMTMFNYFNDGGCIPCEPNTAQQLFWRMQSRWLDGSPVTKGGSGYDRTGQGTPTRFMYPGDPVAIAYWSEFNSDPTRTWDPVALSPADRRFVMGTGPFWMQPGQVETIRFAIVWARGEDHLDSIIELRKTAAQVHALADDLYAPTITPAEVTQPPTPLTFSTNYPNPFTDRTTISYSLAKPQDIRLVVYDALGREVATLDEGLRDAGSYEAVVDGASLAPGIYLYRLELDGFYTFTKRMVRQ